jgi:hypothetical protein
MARVRIYLDAENLKYLKDLCKDYDIELSDVINDLCDWALTEDADSSDFEAFLDEKYSDEESEEEDSEEEEEEEEAKSEE